MKTPKSAVQSTAQLPFQESSSNTTSVQIFNYNGSKISFKQGNTLMVSATQMSTSFGNSKRPQFFLNQQSTSEFLTALSKARNIAFTDLVIVRKGASHLGGGTWFHEDVALEFARWLSPEFAIWCNDKIKELLTRSFTPLKEDVVSKKELLAAQEQVAIWRKTANSALESNKSMTMLIRDLSKELLNELSNEKEVSDSVLRPKTFHKLTSEYYNCAINSFAEWLKCENTSCYASDVRDNRLVKKLEATRLLYNDPKRTIPISIALKP